MLLLESANCLGAGCYRFDPGVGESVVVAIQVGRPRWRIWSVVIGALLTEVGDFFRMREKPEVWCI